VRLLTAERKVPPSEGFHVSLSGELLDRGKFTSIDIEPQDGSADFGLVRPGSHRLNVTTPFGQSYSGFVDVRAGRSHAEEIIVPTTLPQDAEIQFSCKWPDDLRDRDLWV